jgi:hypothetical protein
MNRRRTLTRTPTKRPSSLRARGPFGSLGSGLFLAASAFMWLTNHRVTVPGMTRRRSLRQEPRERGPRHAPAGWARRGANFNALVAIKTQGQASQREMHLRSKHSSTADHRRVPSGTSTGPSEPMVATVTSVRLRAAGPVYGMPHPQPPHELVERALATAITGEPDAPQDFDARKVRILAQPLRDLRRVQLHGRRAQCWTVEEDRWQRRISAGA